ESQQSFPPRVQADNGTTASSVPTSVYSSSLPGQPPYISYPSYYNDVLPPPPPTPALSTDHSQSMAQSMGYNIPQASNPPMSTSDHSQGPAVLGNAPWAPNPLIPPSAGYSQSIGNVPWAPKPLIQPPAENSSSVGDFEYEKFMAEIK
ncbi:hypothetical protein EUTSA_v100114670mg, partial [Eutrema salsugineum]